MKERVLIIVKIAVIILNIKLNNTLDHFYRDLLLIF